MQRWTYHAHPRFSDAEEILEQFETTEDDETEQGDDNDEGDDGPAVDLLDLLSEAAGGAVGDEGTAQVNNDRPREIRGTPLKHHVCTDTS